ncbi:phospholipid scramblase 1 isoform X2 [Folsomia candida]|uniref:Phospholipid scramblase n=1 Tax=Folsomia candida TaxID=158441 RepID=A0A226E4J5_FOLCA|nr:phospholipid scramblase 1 isoform X2 [Folsomia candida]OXA52349.1 Phospholipid scramblase 2 [Folsomia candida]
MNKIQPLSFPNGSEPTPLGLESLVSLDTIFVKQKIELLEAIVGCETRNRYVIMNDQGEELFKAEEESDCCTRQCCGPLRPFELTIRDANDQDVITFSRPLACGLCCFPCCLQSIAVYAPLGQLAGTVEQEWTWWTPKFTVKNWDGVDIFKIVGPCCTLACFSDVEFQIFSSKMENDETISTDEIGRISKKWGGLAREMLTDADNFGISFPVDLDVRLKAVLLGALFLIDFMYFEHNQ